LLAVEMNTPCLHVYTAGGGKEYTQHVHTAACLFLLCDVEKSIVNAGMPENS
jgi:hypothetical protein